MAKNVSAREGEAPSSGAVPTTAIGPVWFGPSRHSETDANLLAATDGPMNFLNFATSPSVASASAAADASGVWTLGSASAISAPASRTRRLSSRFSLLEYVEAEIHTSTPVTSSPTSSTPTGNQNGQRPPPAALRASVTLLALCPPRPSRLRAGHRATVGHRDTGIIAWKGTATASAASRSSGL